MDNYRVDIETKKRILVKLGKWSERYTPKGFVDSYEDKMMGARFVERLLRVGHLLLVIEILKFLDGFELAFLDVATDGQILEQFLNTSSSSLARQIFWLNTRWKFRGFGQPFRHKHDQILVNLERLKSLTDGGELQTELELLNDAAEPPLYKTSLLAEVTPLDQPAEIKTVNLNPVFPLAAMIYFGGFLEVIAYTGRPREKIGIKLFVKIRVTNARSEIAASWSSDGLHLLIFEIEGGHHETTRTTMKLLR